MRPICSLANNTLVIYTNDNGGEWLARNAPLFNRKFSVWEGGIRVQRPMFSPAQTFTSVTSQSLACCINW